MVTTMTSSNSSRCSLFSILASKFVDFAAQKKREVLVLFFAVLGIRGTLKPGEMLVKLFRAGGASAMFLFVIVGE